MKLWLQCILDLMTETFHRISNMLILFAVMKRNKSEIIVTKFLFIKSIKGFNQEAGRDTKLWLYFTVIMSDNISCKSEGTWKLRSSLK